MIADEGIYITYWTVDNQKAYTVAFAKPSELPFNFNKVFGKGPFFSNLDAAKNWANHLKNKYYHKVDVTNIGKAKTPAPSTVLNYIHLNNKKMSEENSAEENNFEEKDSEVLPEKFWMIHSLTGTSPSNRYLEKNLAEKEIYRLATSYPGTKFFLVETVLVVESKLNIKEI
jgi:hypothetical protein